MHSSGRNAAMIRQIVDSPALAHLARRGAEFMASQSSSPSGLRFAANGSMLLGRRDRLEELLTLVRREGALPAETRLLSKDEIALEVESLADAGHEAAIWCPTDGVVDVAGLLTLYLREADRRGARIVTGTEVDDFVVESGRITGVVTATDRYEADVVVNAAGPWCGVVGERAGAMPIGFRPLRRHLFYSGALDWVDPEWPFVWDICHDWYFRPESAGLLLCAGDEDEVIPGEPRVDAAVTQLLLAKLEAHAPALSDVPVARVWSGIRTFASDRSFVIGWDAKIEGFFWVAGLGGHGVTGSYGAAEEAARLLSAGPDAPSGPFSPCRFEN